MNDENSTSNPARLPLAERARRGLLLAEPELLVEELPLLEHPTDKAARLRFAYAVKAAMDFGDLAVVLKPVERMRYEQHEMQRVRVSRDAPVRERPAQDTRKKIVCTENRRYFNREAYRAWRLTCPPDLLSPQSQIEKWLGATPAVETSLPEPEPVARPESTGKRQRIDALGNAIQAALAALSPSGNALPRPHELFDYLAHHDATKTITGIAKGNRALLWIDDNGNEQRLTFPALSKRLDRIRQGG